MPVRMLPVAPLADPDRFAKLDALIRAGLGDRRPIETTLETTRAAARPTAQAIAPVPPANARVPRLPSGAWIAYLFHCAYARPCFVCRETGPCEHREPEVELALMGVGGAR